MRPEALSGSGGRKGGRGRQHASFDSEEEVAMRRQIKSERKIVKGGPERMEEHGWMSLNS